MKADFEEELEKTQIEVQEQTRQNLASDLHDNIGQLLSLTNVTLASINVNDAGATREKLDTAQDLVRRSVKELRHLSKLLHGEQLLQQGLEEAIRQEISWLQRNGYYTIHFTEDTEELTGSNTNKDLFLYRLLQESLNNIIKHAEANTIHIKLSYKNEKIILEITDNGRGFDVEAAIKQSRKGLGLNNMQRRTHLLGGSMQIQSTAESGTIIIFSIPYP